MKRFPTKLRTGEDYAIIKLKKFKNFEVLVMIDEKNGGITVSYDDSKLGPADRLDIQKEIETIISSEMNKIWEED
jgi:hypothetical protein